MKARIEVNLLQNHPEYLPTVARWCATQWPQYYDAGSYDRALEYHRTTMTDNTVPLGMVALQNGKLTGIISILEEDMEIRKQYRPWLGCLYVEPSFRGQGIARELICCAQVRAAEIGLTELYSWTHSLSELLSKTGWQEVERVEFHGAQAGIFRIDIASPHCL